ncbi:hypothetical protein DL98DRAFT_538267 [Cadophora sp. DSE1049]|nr:hypothetical protein DL98DRAFT_538267 [Cadophora sp. DSE1049]
MEGRTRVEAENVALQRELAAFRATPFTPSTESNTLEHREVEQQQNYPLAPSSIPHQITEENERLKAEILKLKNSLKVKEKQIAKLEKDRDVKEPLYQVGVDVRLACLEKAKEAVIAHYNADPDIIKKRNAAVHEGNWKADVSLFLLQIISCRYWYWPPGEKIPYAVWEKIYGILPVKFKSSLLIDLELIEYMNFAFTIFAAKLPDSPGLRARQEVAEKVMKEVLDICPDHDHYDDYSEDDFMAGDLPNDDNDKVNERFAERLFEEELDEEGFDYSSGGRLAKLQAIKDIIVQNDLGRN